MFSLCCTRHTQHEANHSAGNGSRDQKCHRRPQNTSLLHPNPSTLLMHHFDKNNSNLIYNFIIFTLSVLFAKKNEKLTYILKDNCTAKCTENRLGSFLTFLYQLWRSPKEPLRFIRLGPDLAQI